MPITLLKVPELVLDEEIQPRRRLDQGKIDEYAALYAEEVELPPIIVFKDGSQFCVADGFHRTQAAIKAGFEEITADVREGNKREATLYACAAHGMHGVPLTAEDKRRIVTRLLGDPEWSTWSDRQIARHCGVSNDFVSRLRRSLSSGDSEPQPRTYTTRHGTQSTMHTGRIGRKTAPLAPADAATGPPAVPPEPSSAVVAPPREPSAMADEPVAVDVGSRLPADQRLPAWDLAELVEEAPKVLDAIGSQLGMLQEEYKTCTDAEGQKFLSAWSFATAPRPDGRGCNLGELLISAAPLVAFLEHLKAEADTALLPETPPETVPVQDSTLMQRVRKILPQLPNIFTRQDVALQTGITRKQAGRVLRTLVEKNELNKGEDGGYAKIRRRDSSKTTRGSSKS